MRMVIDAMGGDNAPLEIVRGTIAAATKNPQWTLILVGQEDAVRRAAQECGGLPANVQVHPASQVITMEDDPATAFKMKKDSSITVGLNLLKSGEADAFVSAGSTGALLSAGTLLVKRIRGIRRVAMAPVLPTVGGKMVLVDCGANAECTVEYLLQFAFLGSFYASQVLGIANPRVGLLNIGAEDTKGDALRRETYSVLQKMADEGRLNFVGNVEAKEAMKGGCDVLVADGFSGNVMLKTVEGVGSFMGRELKQMFYRNGLSKLAGLLVRRDLTAMKNKLNPDTVGGTPFLGLSRPVIKAHGSSGAVAIENAIAQAAATAASGLAQKIEENIGQMRLGDGE